MNKLIFCLLLAVSVFPRISLAEKEALSIFKDSSVQCDYLIVTIQDYEKPAIALAQHRNSYKFDNVEHAKVVFLSQILSEFPGYEYPQRNIALWKGLKWAREHWKIPFRYLVLIGNDTYAIPDSTIVSTGAIPTWYLDPCPDTAMMRHRPKVFPNEATDDFYIKLSSANPPSIIPLSYFDSAFSDTSLSIGRIPAESAQQCSIYVEKVKFYDLSRPKGAWRNNVLAIADDAMQGTDMDPLVYVHQASAEQVVWLLKGYSMTKTYLSAYPLDQFNEKPSAKSAIIQAMNQGVSWAFFFGHGNDQVLTDEIVLSSENIDGITNDSMPFVFLSFTSFNGTFLPNTPAPMCLKYLFSRKGGAIAYIASSWLTYSDYNKQLCVSFFSEAKKDPSGSIGDLFARAKSKVNDENSVSYFLLGDPALRVSTGVLPVAVKSAPDTNPSYVQLSLPGFSSVNYSVSFTVRDSVRAAPAPQSVPDLSFSRDSVVGSVSGVFRDSAFIAMPQGLTVPIKAIVYVWNDTADGRAELLCNNGSANPVLRKTAPAAAAVRPTLRKVRGGLAVSGLEAGVNLIRIFDVLGRNVYYGEIPAGGKNVSIDLAGKKLRTGRYILQVKGRASEAVMPFIYVAGE